MRKSREQRISDTQAAIAAWAAAGLGTDRRVTFMRDALLRLQRNKGLSLKQREWLDSLCSEGPPAPKGDPALLARIDAACAHVDLRGKEALTSMRGTITRGHKLSEKQEAFLKSLLTAAEKVAKHGHWQPTGELKLKADFACEILSTRASVWKGTHPGTMNAVERYKAWKSDPSAHHIDEYVVEKMTSACAPALREWANPKFEEGELVWVSPLHRGHEATMALVTGRPTALDGHVAYPVLAGAQPLVLGRAWLSSTTRRNKKKA